MALCRRILVVDDVADWRTMLASMLSDQPYTVEVAGNIDEALALFEVRRFHVAILDIRLDESDEDNVAGLDLLEELHRLDPTLAIIMLTGYACVKTVRRAFERDDGGQEIAFSFIEKNEVSTELLPELEAAFAQRVKFNPDLLIHDPHAFLSHARERLRFRSGPAPQHDRLNEEIEELFCRLFADCDEITLDPFSQGHSGTVVVRVLPHYDGRGVGEAVVVKLGETTLVEQEAANYDQVVRGVVGGNRLPQKLQMTRTRYLAGLLYSFAGAGLGDARDFATLYEQADCATIENVLDNLFCETCFCGTRNAHDALDAFDFTDYLRQRLNIDPNALTQIITSMAHSKHNRSFSLDPQNRVLNWQQGAMLLPDPAQFVAGHTLVASTYFCTVHGDLNAWNILVDRHNECWLIDFAAAHQGPALYDFAFLETFIKFFMLDIEDLELLCHWEQDLLLDIATESHEKRAYLDQRPALAKANAAIQKIRSLARAAQGRENMSEYLIELLFDALKTVTRMNWPRVHREHALLSAALIANRLGQVHLP
jgi:CheY-like chemotaxis protein